MSAWPSITNAVAANNYYCGTTGCGTTLGPYDGSIVWQQIQAYTAGAVTYNTANTVYIQNSYVTINSFDYNLPLPAETEEQRIEREQRERDYQAKQEARRKRARAALLLTLNKKQQEQFEKESTFELHVKDRIYRVRPGCRVERLDPKDKKILSYFCIHPDLSHDLPPEDVAISQKLWLEANEAEFLRVANETRAA